MMIRILSAVLIAVGAWGAWQRHQANSLRADRNHWREEAQTAHQAAEQAEAAHAITITTLKDEQARNRDYDAIRAAIAENDDETPIDPVIADALRRLCARDPHCEGDAGGASGAAPAMPRPEPDGQHSGGGGAGAGGLR